MWIPLGSSGDMSSIREPRTKTVSSLSEDHRRLGFPARIGLVTRSPWRNFLSALRKSIARCEGEIHVYKVARSLELQAMQNNFLATQEYVQGAPEYVIPVRDSV